MAHNVNKCPSIFHFDVVLQWRRMSSKIHFANHPPSSSLFKQARRLPTSVLCLEHKKNFLLERKFYKVLRSMTKPNLIKEKLGSLIQCGRIPSTWFSLGISSKKRCFLILTNYSQQIILWSFCSDILIYGQSTLCRIS